MKIILKILAVPFIILFSVLGAVMKLFAWLSSGRIFAAVSFFVGIGGTALLFKGDIAAGIAVLIIALLVSPFGLPAIAEGIAGLLDGANDSLKHFITA